MRRIRNFLWRLLGRKYQYAVDIGTKDYSYEIEFYKDRKGCIHITSASRCDKTLINNFITKKAHDE